jgi:branched-chain amino acid transport system ATP-binding protein
LPTREVGVLPKILEIKGIRKFFGNLRALDDISFDIDREKITILIGPNGSGKSTLVNVISGFYKPDEGDIFYNSRKITGWPPHKIYRIGISRTFQIPMIYPKLTVLENVLVSEKHNAGESFLKAPFRKLWAKSEEEATEKAAKILELLGLALQWEKQANTLSGGQLKLLELGKALMSGAELFLLDEPISGVNPTLAHQIFGTIVRLRDELGITFIIVEHRLDIAFEYSDRVVAMAYGKLVTSGTAEEVVKNQAVIDAYLGG